MSSACLCAVALLTAADPAEAKPPDLPIDQDYYVTPRVYDEFADWVLALASSPADERCDSIYNIGLEMMPCEADRARVNLPWLFQLSPTPRRHFASYLLFGIHPLLLLMPTDRLLDAPTDHPCPEPMPIITGPLEVLGPKRDPGAAPLVSVASYPYSEDKVYSEDADGGEKRGREAEREIARKLDRPVSLSFSDAPLREVIDDLRTFQGMNIYLDVRAFEEEGIRLDDLKVNVALDGVSFKSALDLILRPCGLAYVIQDEVLQVTTPAHARGKLQTKLYKVKDLLPRPRLQTKDAPTSPEEQLVKLIASTVAPQSWREMGGQGVIEYFPTTRTLVINQTADVQEQVGELLASLRRVKDRWEGDKREADARREATRVDGLLKACRILHETGSDAQAEKLACEAFALDADKVLDDAVVSQIYLRVRQQSKYRGDPVPAETDPGPCGVCPAGYGRKDSDQATPILELLQSSPSVDRKAARELEVVEEESECVKPDPVRPLAVAKPFRAAQDSGVFEVTTAKEGPHDEVSFFGRLGDWLELCLPEPPGHGCFEIGFDPNGLSLCLFGEYRVGGVTVHVTYRHGSLALWATPDAGPEDDDK
jgi:hypothetical protein